MTATKMAAVFQAARSTTTPTTIIRYTSLPRRTCNPQQARGFRFSLWSSYLDPAFQKELQRRHRVVKHKHTESLSRRLAWDRRLPTDGSHWGLKSFMCGSWRANGPRSGGRHVNVDELNDMTKSSGPTKSRGVEEVNQPASDKWFRYREAKRLVWNGRSSRWTLLGRELTPATFFRTTISISSDPEPYHNEEILRQPLIPCSEEEYDTDPISNRKVFRKKTFKMEPKSQASDLNMPDIPIKRFKDYQSQFSKFGPPIENNPGQPIHLHEGLSTRSERQTSSQTKPKQEKLDKYKPFMYNEPDREFLEKIDPVSEVLKDFDHEYRPFILYDSDGKSPQKADPVSEGLSDFDRPVAGSNTENHTLPAAFKPEPELLNKFTGSTGKCNVASGSRWPSQGVLSSDVKGSPGRGSPSKFSTPTKSPVNRKHDEEIEDLDLLRASDVRAASGIIRGPRKETKAEKENRRAALEVDFNEIRHPNKSSVNKTEATRDRESHQLAIAFEIERSYLQNFIAHAKAHMEAEKAELERTTDRTERGYLLKRIAYAVERMETRKAQLAELEKTGRPSNQAEIENWQHDTRQAGESTCPEDLHKLTWNFSRDFPEDFSTSWMKKDSSTNDCLVPKKDVDAPGPEMAPIGPDVLNRQRNEGSIHSAENDYATSANASAQDASTKETSSARIETALHRSLKAAEPVKQPEYDPQTKEPIGLETSHVRCENPGPNLSQPAKTSETESALPSVKSEAKFSDQELIQEIQGIYETAYGTIDIEHRQPKPDVVVPAQTPQATSPPPRPNPYILLVADPGVDFVWSAEITSVQPERIALMAPTEALLQLSDPVKYLNLLKQFQSQGYEIVNGTENYLVLRKGREETVAKNVESNISASTTPAPRRQQVVNPIDGMQRFPNPATGNFASPTGFVNHDLPDDDHFISGIDVRREEPVFSGQKSSWKDGQETSGGFRKKSRKRAVLLGAVWLGACSYAVGVVVEYFKTGGSDWKGPVGF